VAADGRSSVLRERAGLTVDEIGAAVDVLWMRLSKHLDDPDFVIHANRRQALVRPDRREGSRLFELNLQQPCLGDGEFLMRFIRSDSPQPSSFPSHRSRT
jgi:hypothetical protein